MSSCKMFNKGKGHFWGWEKEIEMDWKDLDISNLPSDILVGDYEFQRLEQIMERTEICTGMDWRIYGGTAFGVVYTCDQIKYRYRKVQPKPPTHEEIMIKWWKGTEGRWKKVNQFIPGRKLLYGFLYEEDFCNPSWFIGRESADIPPEAE